MAMTRPTGTQPVLVPEALPTLLRAVHAALVEHRDEVDALNVFPVPDGDTGTNLAATAEGVLASLAEGGTAEPGDLVRAALRAARGNSGVIFSQVVRAVVEAVAGRSADAADVEVLATALERADHLAREAVANPVEGTILTALRAAAAAAREVAGRPGGDLRAALVAVDEAVADAVHRTRDLLEVLRDAGVVDAGARGLEVALAAVHATLVGAEVRPSTLDRVVPRCGGDRIAHGRLDRFPIEVQYLVERVSTGAAGALRERLAALGDSVVVVEADGVVSAHVHTADPDAAVAAAADLGGASEVRTVDLREAAEADRATVGVVAVVPAGGLADLARGSGAAIVPGAAGHLPSVQDLLAAARTCPDGPVAVLPGHPNVVPTARQAALLAGEDGREVVVVEAADHPLVVLSCLAQGDVAVEALRAAAGRCAAGEVVAAVRDATTPVGPVRAGQPLVVVEGQVVAATADLPQALVALLDALDAAGAGLVTVAVGADAGLDVGGVMAAVAEHAGDAEVDVVDGGQRPSLLLALAER